MQKKLLIVATFMALGALAATNLYPDPGFEKSGSTDTFHSGSRAGKFLIPGKGWKPMRGTEDIRVEPFASYKLEAWVKGSFKGGSLRALYTYGWNSYGWGFMRSVAVPNDNAWHKVETTFAVPAKKVSFCLLVSENCTSGVGYIDDVSFVRLKSAEQTIGALRSLKKPSSEQRMLLARWYLRKNRTKEAQALLAGGDLGSQADIACLFAQRAEGKEERMSWLVQMIRFNCIRWPDSRKRLRELTRDLSIVETCKVAVEALRQSKGAAFAQKAVDEILLGDSFGKEGLSVAESLANLKEVESLLGAVPDAAVLGKLPEKVTEMRQEIETRKENLGRLRLFIAKQRVTSETYQIVVANNPTPSEERAARDLRFHLEAMTGEYLKIVRSSEADQRYAIVVGRAEFLNERHGFILSQFDALGDEGIHLLVDHKDLLLIGNKRGVLYAVYTFLEDYCGCRWFTEDCTRIPKRGIVRIDDDLDFRYLPPFEYRDTDYPNCRPPVFGVRNKLNGIYSRADESWGGRIKYRGFVHTFRHLVSPDKYFDSHPEYFSEINGVRVRDRSQLCLTNPEVLQVAIESVRRWMRESPDCQIISVSQNDWHNYCRCEACTALAEKEGSQCGPLLHFVNGIADAVREERPDLIIDTLAYQYTRKPPKFVKPRPNVAVRLCSIECCFTHSLEKCEFNKKFVSDIRQWSRICDRLHIWDYVINYHHTILPFPNFRVLQPNIQFFRDNGVTGIYEEANYFSRGGEMAELRTYVMSKLLWDPDCKAERAKDEFIAAYYGPAGRYVNAYLDLIHKKVCSNRDRHVRIYSNPDYYLNDPEMIARAVKLFDQAEAAVAGDAVLLHRVRVARMPIQYLQLTLGKGKFVFENDQFSCETGGNADIFKAFVKTARAEKVSHVREGKRGDLNAWINKMSAGVRPVKVLRLQNKKLSVALIPELGGRIWSIKHLPSGIEAVKQFGDAEKGWAPAEGGFEEYSSGGYRAPGWSEKYRVVEQGADFALLEAAVDGAYIMRRRIELIAGKAELVITSDLINSGKTARESQLRRHPAFSVGDTKDAVVHILHGRKWEATGLANPAEPLAEKELWLRGASVPNGVWKLEDKGTGLCVTNLFDPAQVATCYVNWNGAQRRVNLEQWSVKKKLAGGEKLTLRNVYEIRVK